MSQFAPPAEAGGLLHLGSTAAQCPEAGALLWFHSPMHQGQVTNAPSLPSMPDKERFKRPRTFYPIADSRWEPSREARQRTWRRTVFLRRSGVPLPPSTYSF